MKEVYDTNGNSELSLDGMIEYDFGENDRQFSAESRYRYSVLVADDGSRYFSKQLAGIDEEKDKKWSEYLNREAAWASFALHVGENYPELAITGLVSLRTDLRADGGVQRLIYPYIDAPFLTEPQVSIPLRNPQTLSRYVKILKVFDTAAQDWQSKGTIDSVDEHTPFDQVDKSWDEWLRSGELYEKGYLTPEMVAKARQVVEDHKLFMTARFQHGDFVPWHIFNDSSGKWISFDGEHASTQKPRFYDLAYSYSRLFTVSRDSNLAARMLGGFIVMGEENQEFTRDEFFASFLPVLMSRSMGMFLDAANDSEKGNDYLIQANDLFNRCQTRNLGELLR